MRVYSDPGEKMGSGDGSSSVVVGVPDAAQLADKRIFSLDVLRGVAIALVVLLHFPPTTLSAVGVLEDAVSWLTGVGWIGVDLFFVLSGLLISRLIYSEYDRTGKFDAARFWLRRGFKIWPSYFAAYGSITFLRVAWESFRGDTTRAAELLRAACCNAFFLQNYLPCERWVHSWSLAVEEHFYTVFALIAGLLVWTASKRQLPGSRLFLIVAAICVLLMFVVLALRTWSILPSYSAWAANVVYVRSHFRIDSLSFGVLLGYLVHYRGAISISRRIGGMAVPFALAIAFVWPTIWPKTQSVWLESIGFTLIYLSFGVAVYFAATSHEFGRGWPRPWPAVLRSLAWLGTYSYTIYLGHSVLFGIPGAETLRQLVLAAVVPMLGIQATLWLDRGVYLAASVVAGVLLSKVVERPFLRLRGRLLPSGRLSRAPA